MQSNYIAMQNGRLGFSKDFFQTLLSRYCTTSITVTNVVAHDLPSSIEVSKVKHPENTDYPVGIFKYQVSYQHNSKIQIINLFIKAKVSDKNYLTNVANLFQNHLGVKTDKPLADYLEKLNFSDINARELIIYKLQQHHPQLKTIMPEYIGADADPKYDTSILVLRSLTDNYAASNAINFKQWTTAVINSVIDALSVFHKIWYGNIKPLENLPTIKYVNSAAMQELTQLWKALVKALAPAIGTIITESDQKFFSTLIKTLPNWTTIVENSDKTLTHNDCTPKNIAVKFEDQPRAFLLDFEQSTIHLPQRDLIEILAYVLPEHHSKTTLQQFLIRHKQQLNSAMDEKTWYIQCQAAIYDYCLQRLMLYILIEPFEPRDIQRIFKTVKQMLIHLDHLIGEK